jgi:hypothetical protein
MSFSSQAIVFAAHVFDVYNTSVELHIPAVLLCDVAENALYQTRYNTPCVHSRLHAEFIKNTKNIQIYIIILNK